MLLGGFRQPRVEATADLPHEPGSARRRPRLKRGASARTCAREAVLRPGARAALFSAPAAGPRVAPRSRRDEPERGFRRARLGRGASSCRTPHGDIRKRIEAPWLPLFCIKLPRTGAAHERAVVSAAEGSPRLLAPLCGSPSAQIDGANLGANSDLRGVVAGRERGAVGERAVGAVGGGRRWGVGAGRGALGAGSGGRWAEGGHHQGTYGAGSKIFYGCVSLPYGLLIVSIMATLISR